MQRSMTALDDQFYMDMALAQGLGEEQLVLRMGTWFHMHSEKNREIFERYFKTYPFWGTLCDETKDYDVFSRRARILSGQGAELTALYERLEDYRSKRILHGVVVNWMSLQLLDAIKERTFPMYFDPDVMRCGPEEVLVDVGAYYGDSVRDYQRVYGDRYRRIYCYEITPSVFETLEQNMAKHPNVVCVPKGASDAAGTLYLSEQSDASANWLEAQGEVRVPTVQLDDDIDEPITFLKMDIEGGEQKALRGCRRHISQEKPKLAISVYHGNEDLLEVPRLIDEICPGYRFYLRYHGGNLVPTELTLLAVHPDAQA